MPRCETVVVIRDKNEVTINKEDLKKGEKVVTPKEKKEKE